MTTFLGLGLHSQSTGFLAVIGALGIVRALRQVLCLLLINDIIADLA